VSINFIGEQENEDGEAINFTDSVLLELPKTIERLLTEKKYQPKDITILTRGNYEAKLVIQTLMKYQQNKDAVQYDLLSAEALLLAANPSVQLLVAAMKYLVDQNDLLSRALMVQNIAERFGTTLPQHQWYASNGQGAELLPPKYYSNRIHLAGLPLVELASQLIDIFELNEVPNHQAYLLAFQDLMMERNRFGEDGLYGFLQYWENEGCKKSLPSIGGGNAVEVMTVHKSKGLAFNVLIMPFCNWALEPDAKKNNWLWVKTEHTPFGNVPVVPIKYQKELAKSYFAKDYFEERLLAQMDALNLLYVAFTRAKSQIIAYAPLPKPPKKDEDAKLNTVGDLLFASLVSGQWSVVSGQGPIDRETIHHSPFTIHFGDVETQAGTASEVIEGIKLAKINNNDWRQILGIRPSNFLVGEDAVSLPRKRGTLLHEAMCLLQHPQELPMVLQQMKMKGLVDDSAMVEMQETLSKILAQPIFETWKTNAIQRFGEREIVGADQLLKRPDLVLTDENNTWVIDFKFGEKRENKHHKQVKEYVELLQQMEFKNVKGYLLYGMENEMVEVE
jgi:ATP-dependent exoDNAse (exonuclease V) beta subunit